MNEIHTIVVGMLNTPPFDKRFQLAKRVYAVKGSVCCKRHSTCL